MLFVVSELLKIDPERLQKVIINSAVMTHGMMNMLFSFKLLIHRRDYSTSKYCRTSYGL